MSKIEYTAKEFSPAHESIIVRADAIMNEYSAQGYDITLRQLYYQFVARGLIPNNDKEYKRLGGIINDARLAGRIDWNHIVDRTRNLRGLSSWSTPGDVIDSAAHSYRVDKWSDQDHRVEVWVEKDALVGVIERACNALQVDYFSCRGYTSQTEVWGAAMRLSRYDRRGQIPIVLHFGDHDPSGIDMTRDIRDRFAIFGCTAEVKRLALNHDQVKKYKPPPNPTKLTDSRATGYIKKFGRESWELDALEPSVIAALIDRNVKAYRDEERWKARVEAEAEQREQLKRVAEHWEDVLFVVP